MSPRVHIETAGCAFNVSDSEAMAGVLRSAGHEVVSDAATADVLILNTCTVKDKTLRTFRRRLNHLTGDTESGLKRRVVLAGCIPKAQPNADFLKGIPLLGPDAVGRVNEIVAEALAGNPTRILDADDSPLRNRLPILRRNPAVEILPIARGCRSACTFCQTRLARGRLISFPPGEILAQARRALDEGVKIFWVTGQDTGAYGHDIGLRLNDLLEQLLALPGDFRVRLGMSSPQWIAERLDAIMETLAHSKMFKFLHVPLQSGSDRVLTHMKRDGGVEDFRKIHAAFRANFPRGSFVTDMIVGYPTETDEDFEATLSLVRELRLGLINVSKFSPRPGTVAARLPLIPANVIKERAARLLSLIQEITRDDLQRELGSTTGVLVETKERDGLLVARDANYRPIHLLGEFQPGTQFLARITGAQGFHLTASAPI